MAGPEQAVAALRELIIAGAGYRSAVAARRGIGPRENEVIGHLLTRGAMRPNDLADALRISAGSVTNLIDRLAARDLVVRGPAPNDRRATLIELTPRAIAYAGESWQQLAACFDQTPGADTDDAVRILTGLARALRDRSADLLATGFGEPS